MKLQKLISHFLLFFLGVQLLSQSYFAYALIPSDISSQVFHFDAQNLDADYNISTQPIDNSRISELLDLANTHTGSQADINKQAQFQLTGLNNKPALFFDGVDDLYTLDDHINIASAEEYSQKSLATVFKTSSDIASLQTIYEQGGKEKGYALQIDAGKLYIGAWNSIDWPSGEQFKIADLGMIQTNTVYNVMMSQNSDMGNNLAIYLDGSLVKNILTVSKQTTHGTCIISGAFSCYMFSDGGSIGLGATKNDTLQLSNNTELTANESHHFEGYIGEIMTWNTALSNSDVFGLFIYFDQKWSLKSPDITVVYPAITGVVPENSFDMYMTYNDFQNGGGINLSSDDLKIYSWNGSAWSADLASSYVNFATKSITQFEAHYPVSTLPEGKYRLEFSISKTNGLSSTQTRDFYVGELSPNNILNPVFHYDAQDINADGNLNNNPANNSTIQTLTDKFNAYNAFQNTVARRPVLINNSINSYPAISFNGTSQYFDITNQTIINTRTNPLFTEKSFAAVFQTGNDVNTFQTIFEQGGNARGYSFVVDGGSVYAGVWNTSEWDTGHQYKSVNLGPAQPNTTYFAMIVQDSQTADDNLNTLKIYLNGNLASVQTHTDAQRGHPGTISIGRVNGNTVSASTNTVINTSGHYFNGKIGELISWNHALDQADVNGVQEYFSNKWGIVLFSEKYVIPSPTSDTTPAYTFTTNRAGSLTYSGDCSSTTSNATIGENIINLSADNVGTPLSNGSYNNCVIELLDGFGNTHVLNITAFSVVASVYTLTEITPVPATGTNHFPEYTFSSPIEGNLEYSGDCSSNTSYANVGNNTITLNYLTDGYYENCYVRVTNITEDSEYLLLSAFTLSSSAPSFTSSTIDNDDILPSGNIIYSLNYSDLAGIDISSRNVILQKYNSATLNWGTDISTSYLSELSVTTSQIQYNSSISDFGKYRLQFSIENIHGTSSTFERIFYIDSPEFVIDRGEIDLGNLSAGNTSYSTPVEIQVSTVGASFNMLLKKENLMQSGNGDIIQDYDGGNGYGYQSAPYSGPLEVITNIENIGTQSKNINMNGEKNTYIYYMRLGALIDELQAAGNYNGNIQFGIQLQYD